MAGAAERFEDKLKNAFLPFYAGEAGNIVAGSEELANQTAARPKISVSK